MRIKIINISHPNVWYREKLGQEYKVNDLGNGLLERKNNHFYKLFASDCEEVVDEKITEVCNTDEEVN
jgi:uncharacterized protein YdcH (DUF465 family)